MAVSHALSRRRGPDPVVAAAFALAAAAFAAQATAQLVDYWAFHLRYSALNGNSTASAFSWVSAAAIFGTAVAFAWIAIVAPERRRIAAVIAVLFTFLLADNRAHLHERLAHGKVVFLPMLGTAFVLLWRFSGNGPSRHRLLVRGGLVFLAVSLFVHLGGPSVLQWAGWHSNDWQYQVKVALKESTEKAGWTLVCFGAAVALWARRGAN